ncbi:MAG: hypothetical protein KC518_10645, partial [Candidatus Cloacimonetes bacterium]|nr:hypothetical protein [Candidatus Cloacimonadota bacterium]
DGATEHEWECSSPCPPVITGCGQERRDVVLTASILALGCGFGVEYWKTTTTPSPDPAPQMYCAGWRDTQAESLDCGQVDTASDLRGAIWLTGSLCTTMHGQWVTQIWWPSTIGYEDRFLRHDPNLLLSPPPFWPELVFEDPDWLEVQLSASGHSWCGLVEDPSAFRDAWNFGVIHLIVNADPHTICDQERLRLEIWQDGQLASHLDTVVTEGRSLNLNPGMPLPEEGTHTLHLELTWDTQVWNRGGELCQWQVDFTDLALDGRARPQAFELAVFPNPFNPGTTVSFNLPARETLRLVVHDLTGRRIRVLELGSREAGPQSVYWDGHSDGGQDAPSGVYFLGIEGGSGRLGVVKALLVR